MKIKLTVENVDYIYDQMRRMLSPEASRVEVIEAAKRLRLEIDDSQIIPEKTNLEKWKDVMSHGAMIIHDSSFRHNEIRLEISRLHVSIARTLDDLGYDATKAFEFVCKDQ